MTTMTIDKEKMSFEEALTLLQNQIAALEKGNLPLDEALKTFQDAIAVSRLCNEKLEHAQSEVKKIVEDGTGYGLEDFEC